MPRHQPPPASDAVCGDGERVDGDGRLPVGAGAQWFVTTPVGIHLRHYNHQHPLADSGTGPELLRDPPATAGSLAVANSGSSPAQVRVTTLGTGTVVGSFTVAPGSLAVPAPV